MTDTARVELDSSPGILVARLIGEVDLANARLLEEELTRSVSNTTRTVVLDLSETTYLDSAGIRLVFGLAERLKRRGQGLCLVVPEGAAVERVLELTNVSDVATLERTLASALSAHKPTAD